MELDELVEHWTLLVDEQELIAGKRGSTRLGSRLLKFYVIEPPAAKRVDRIVRSALHQAEQTLTRRIVEAMPADVVERLHALVAVDGMEDDDLVGAWRLRADQVGAGQRQPGLDADSRPASCGRSARSASRPVCSPASRRRSSRVGGLGPRWNRRRTCVGIPIR
jgi:hypothetical protein